MWFGKFLLESGDISESQLIDSIVARHESKVPIGKIAIEDRILSISQVSKILASQVDTNKPFGMIGIELGFMSEDDLFLLLGKQETQSTSLQQILLESNVLTKSLLQKRIVQWHKSPRKTIACESDLN